MDANQTTPRYELKDELARLCLPSASRDVNLKLAWVNSVCILFLLIGIRGRAARRDFHQTGSAHPGGGSGRRPADGVAAPGRRPKGGASGTTTPSRRSLSSCRPRRTSTSACRPSARWSRPPPLPPRRTPQVAPLHTVGSLNNTGAGGERPEPPYPKIALEVGATRHRHSSLTGDDAGNVVSVDVKTSSGFPILDRATVDFIKRHWRLPTDGSTRLFETSITYKLLLN